ncbi:cysteine desulfurase NifS [candidate division WOR-1 bacterium RIFOXYA12_FULL_43_27]|uniref:Cysteine desulfurase IscS n=1 Tax=candidate division WOR-1 bacterium RIFOXYC2_FULL_46_14 TaxID=1802587 RepID=A0A1F4U5N4_UNCSA|nr:MAG: cysteine desulfurase NifS [candidate division WOR-1 bacterium RIFOXYA12_FULL_43_27]OGC20284.1 MAG: cysteine desulfurase NifS [candidate division WOR-1 bacterium RIFOXYB2_FULL_46_45]OGC31979.1 MAG: cysteine desulfurase NifS [candidate division WOR-1 bacterium RIFOXYA2_FULL_46_56]OGC40130.1 MAG: cysteine desulfurase NifS [candidate division WOR-1 bacterium RIFOXYC2_FULL_46_14]
MDRIYLDYAATTPALPEVIAGMLPYFKDNYGNPSSIHSFGQEAKAAIDSSREKIAKSIGAKAEEIVFTSGGTESDNFALEGVAFKNQEKGNHIIVSKIEHHAVLECAEFLGKHGFEVTTLPVDRFGVVNPEDLKKVLTDKTILVSIMHANNEIGTIQPIAELSKIAKEKGIYFHTDAVQSFGHLPINVDKLGIDLLSLSGHKFYGPKGIGALYIKKGTRMVPFLHGGGQERNRRASTENVPGIVGMGIASEIVHLNLTDEINRETVLRDKLINAILKNIPDTILNGHPTERLPNNANFSIKYIEGESILLNLDMLGIAGSSGSACTSGSLDPSHVLLSIGLPHEIAHGSLRLTLGRFTEEKEIDYVIENLPPIVEKLRAMSPIYKKES